MGAQPAKADVGVRGSLTAASPNVDGGCSKKRTAVREHHHKEEKVVRHHQWLGGQEQPLSAVR